MPDNTIAVERNQSTQTVQIFRCGSGRYWCYGTLLLVVLFVGFIRVRLRNMPLERDEGEYAYAGQLILQGIPPYQLAYNLKLPGTYVAYSVILAGFGQTPGGIRLGLLLVNAATILLVYLLATRLFDSLAGIAAAASYGLLSIDPSVMGFAGHATHFVVLASVGGILLLLRAVDSGGGWTLFWSGFLMGLAFLMKQPGIFLVAFGGLYLIKSQDQVDPVDWQSLIKKIGVFAFGAVVPFATTCLILFHAGVFRAFWFWTFSYARQYSSSLTVAQGYMMFRAMFPRIVANSWALWIISGLGLASLALDRKARSHSVFLVGFLFFSFLAICPGFFFREHYFILILPAISLLIGLAVSAATQALRQAQSKPILTWIPVLVLLAASAYSIFLQREFLFVMDPATACRYVYGANPFPEALEIAAYIKNHTSESSRIVVLGSEPEIYFYAHRHSATGYIYTYGLMETQKYAFTMQKEMIREVESAQPEFLVLVGVPTSWLARRGSPQEVAFLNWAQPFIAEHYELEGTADILPSGSEYRWGDEAKNYQPRSSFVVHVFKRKPSQP
jgi:Dolichyl-phosphate-mannose-protein mannosyltransferase